MELNKHTIISNGVFLSTDVISVKETYIDAPTNPTNAAPTVFPNVAPVARTMTKFNFAAGSWTI